MVDQSLYSFSPCTLYPNESERERSREVSVLLQRTGIGRKIQEEEEEVELFLPLSAELSDDTFQKLFFRHPRGLPECKDEILTHVDTIVSFVRS